MAKKNILLLVLVVLGMPNRGVVAQEPLTAPLPAAIGDLPPQLPSMPIPSGSGTRSEDETENLPPSQERSESSSLVPFAEPISSGDLQESADQYSLDENAPMLGLDSALLESSGTWLRRGFWYTEVDIVVTDRIWRQDAFVLMDQQVGVVQSTFNQFFPQSNKLLINGGQNGAEAAPRLKLGRFLFRDGKNRDHAVELVVYGGGQWSQNGRLDANPLNSANNSTTLDVPNQVDRGNTSFSGATSSQFEYNSRLNSFELNYHVSARMGRDRMELEPSGHWVRRAQTSTTKSLTAGIRYLDLSENLVWDAFGFPDADGDNLGEVGNYDVRVGNDLIGTQLGFSWTHERARWSLGAQAKGGMFLNRSDVNSSYAVTGTPIGGSNDIKEDNISFLTDASLTAKWHLRPNFSLRAGLEILFLTSLASAPEQINFAPVSTSEVIAGGSSTFMGGSIGFESYW